MKRILICLTAVLCLFAFSACKAKSDSSASPSKEDSLSSSAAGEYQKITPEQAKEKMDGDSAVIVVDVRTQEEYDQGHIANAVLIPNENITTEKPAELPDLDAEILVYCRSGNRSRQAANKLIAMGYTNVYDFGGINSWPYETVTE